ncbi:conserved Plasmodium protein, unknown function [Plasmodium knowlesi strain H]|uniref:Uncharacterized protein n=3 Tax=Plasmodium knowlesi TaxID=5850 RepID=A0A5K1V5L6_PLAKH|nr:conserved Plasmodium protein, unknown function [Plasmodium knowlesi strain H]OTN65207.1 Uncharacterized protein PKNOH_S120161000 [Plasmodium knowlesi]CAA9988466.1 conserved Plasmodium protein, unknown function [Plasmodium knowlesi strain H]SBO19786.1 conserved Plasmodium protein, unknown function [Plasmodium knowlesi strain H]SBO20465.1 conserved Plasmodium protein, unknown function [Plasmodium knowlesi strain H]VVS77940.1 conserved Plasmodium protein, unknown function [Plasmodium knowlesi |eukprot:XP_002259447.1 hypothetical protein, conserved in Plasmodium species [Plasmodium knowlesi strain H]
MKHRAEAELGGGNSLSPSRHPRREKITPLMNLKKALLDADVLIDVSKIKIYAKENFDLELINNVNDRFVEKTYNLLLDTRKNIIPEDELNDFIFLLMNERKENSQLEKMSRKGHDKSESAKCPIKNEVTNLIKKMNKFHFYFKEFLKKDKLWMDVADRCDGKGTTWGNTKGTTLDNRRTHQQSPVHQNTDNACRKDRTYLSHIQRKGEKGMVETLYSQSKERKEHREKTERAIRSLLSSGLSEMEEMTEVPEEIHNSFAGLEHATKKMAPFTQCVKVQKIPPSSSDGNKVIETENAQPYPCYYVERGGCAFQKGWTNLAGGRSTHNRGRHKEGTNQLGGVPDGENIGDGNISDGNISDGNISNSSSGDDDRPSEVLRRSHSDGAKYYLYRKHLFEDRHRQLAHGSSLTEYERYIIRRKKKKKKKKNNNNKDKGNQNRESLISLQVPNVLTCDWKKYRRSNNKGNTHRRNNVDNYLGDAYNSCEHPVERNPILGASYEEDFSRSYLHEENNHFVHTVLGTKEEKRHFSKNSGYAKGNIKGNIKGHAMGGITWREDGGYSTTGKKGLTPPSVTTRSAPIIPQEVYYKKGVLIKSDNNSYPEGEKRSDELCPDDGEGQLSEVQKRGRDDIHLKVPNGPWHLARSDKGNGIISASGTGSTLPSGRATKDICNGSGMRKKGSSGGFHTDGEMTNVKDNGLTPPSGVVDKEKKGDRIVDHKKNVSIEKKEKTKNEKLHRPVCEQTDSSTKGHVPGKKDDNISHFDEEIPMDKSNEWKSDIESEGELNTLEESKKDNRNYIWSANDLNHPHDYSPTVSAKDINELEFFERKVSTLLHPKGEVAPNIRSEENYDVRNKNVKKYEEAMSNSTSTMDYPNERHTHAHRDICSSVSQNGERSLFPDYASTLGRDNADMYVSSDERIEDVDLDERYRRTHPRREQKYNSFGKETLHKHGRNILPEGAMKEGEGSNFSKSSTYDHALIRHMEQNAEFYENISRDMEGFTRGLQNESFYNHPGKYLHGDDCSPHCTSPGHSAMSFSQKDFLLLKKKREENSRLSKWLNKINARENERKKKIQEKKNESIKKELVNCTFHPRVSIIHPNKVKSFIKEEGRKGGNMKINTKGYIKLGPHNGKDEYQEDTHVLARGVDRRAGRAKGITRINTGWTDTAYDNGGILPMDRYEEAVMRENVVGRMNRNIGVRDPHGRVPAGGAARRGYHTRGRYTDGEIPGEEDMHSENRNCDDRSSGEEPYRESKVKQIDRNELLYWKAMKQKEHLQRKKDAFEESKENKFKSECKFSPEIKDNVKIYMSDLPKGYNKTVERIKRGVEEKRRVHNFLEYRIPVNTNEDKNAQNSLRSKWQGGRTTTLSPFSFDKGFYKVKIKPVYFETKIRLSENKIASLAIREDEDPLYIIDIFCKIHAIKDEDKRVLYEYVMDELGKASQGS